MKRIFLFLLFMIFVSPVMAADTAGNLMMNKSVIEDELIKNSIFLKNIKPGYIKELPPIKDELLDPKSYGDSVFKLSAYKHKYQGVPITDELIDRDFIANAVNSAVIVRDIPDDYFFEKSINTNHARKIKSKVKYDFTKQQIPIRIKIAQKLKSTKEIKEGTDIPFISEHDFEINGKKYEKGTIILGRVETISDSDKMGVPECIKIDNFYIAEDENINLYGSISKTGANRALWVYPLYQAGNITLYAAGFVFVPIHGGKAKLSTSETFTVFYEVQ